MSDRRTLEELKLLLQGSYRAEEALEERLFNRLMDLKQRFRPATAEEAAEYGLSPEDIKDLEFQTEIKNQKRERLKKARDQMSGSDRTEYKKSFLEKRRRKIIADELRAVRRDIPNPKEARAALYDILRADAAAANRLNRVGWDGEEVIPLHAKNPIGNLMNWARTAGDSVIDDEEYYRGEFFADTWSDSMAQAERGLPYEQTRAYMASREGILDDIKKNPDSDLAKRYRRTQQRVFNSIFPKTPSKRDLRRATLSDLKELLTLAVMDFSPATGEAILAELNRRGEDEINRSMGRRHMMARTAGQVIKPTLPTGPGGGSGGEKVAKTFLRLLSRGRMK